MTAYTDKRMQLIGLDTLPPAAGTDRLGSPDRCAIEMQRAAQAGKIHRVARVWLLDNEQHSV